MSIDRTKYIKIKLETNLNRHYIYQKLNHYGLKVRSLRLLTRSHIEPHSFNINCRCHHTLNVCNAQNIRVPARQLYHLYFNIRNQLPKSGDPIPYLQFRKLLPKWFGAGLEYIRLWDICFYR